MQAILRPRLSETSVALNGWLRGIAEVTIEPQFVDIYWRYDDEPDMVPQYLGSAVPGETVNAPFPHLTRTIRLFQIPRAGTGAEAPQNFTEAEQTVFTPSSPESAGARGGPLFDHFADASTGVGGGTLYIDYIPPGLLSTNGDKIAAIYSGEFTFNAASFIAVIFGGTTIFITASIAADNVMWRLEVSIIRVDETTVRHGARFTIDGTVSQITSDETTGLDLDGTAYGLELSCIVDGADDVIAHWAYGEFIPSANTLIDGDPITFLGDPITFLGEPITFTP